ncbi:MAG: sodium ion-translocating decarboxylase subunit beta [Puniceicoccales bacterium]|jgi:oxaloacetate decarboxylase beta subunit|nr:sodium ion-translocating decarboxylase subunit beta [Puniceicoccales bacterium]
MDKILELINLTGFPALADNPGMLIMWAVIGVLMYLAVFKEFEPLLLIPISFGALLANLPSENLLEEPAGPIVASAPGTVIGAALTKGKEVQSSFVPIEIAEHLSRYKDPAAVKKLFAEEAALVKGAAVKLVKAVKEAEEKCAAAKVAFDKAVADKAAGKATDADVKEAERLYGLAHQARDAAAAAKKDGRTAVIGFVIRPEGVEISKDAATGNALVITDLSAGTAGEQWNNKITPYAIEVPWFPATATLDEIAAGTGAAAPATAKLLITKNDRVASVPPIGTTPAAVTKALAVGTKVKRGEQIADLHSTHVGGLYHFIKLGVLFEIFPPLIFLGIGALTDFGPLIANPKTLLLGAAAQLGVFFTFITAVAVFGFTGPEAASIGIIGGADGPTSIFLSNKLAPHLMAAIAVAAYSYMALVPMIQPPIMRALTTLEERKIRMKTLRKVGRLEKLVFSLVVTVLCILLVPSVAPLIGMLMLGNFVRESGVAERLSKMAQNELINIVTIFLGTSVGITMTADRFLRFDTLAILALGIVAFSFSTAGGVWMAKIMNLFLKEKINPLIGSAGVSAVPMAARVSQNEGVKYDRSNFLLMHAMGPNVAGVIGTAIAAGFFIALYAH